jgi:hypothetical protein
MLRGCSRLCAWALARAHARSGDAATISGYLGSSRVGNRTLFSILLLALCLMAPAAGFAQTQATPTSVQLEEEKLERDFTDPLSTLPQLILRDSYTPANYGPCTLRACVRNDETNQLIIRPLIPRVPPNTLLPFMQLIRPTFTLVTVPLQRRNPYGVRRPATF